MRNCKCNLFNKTKIQSLQYMNLNPIPQIILTSLNKSGTKFRKEKLFTVCYLISR